MKTSTSLAIVSIEDDLRFLRYRREVVSEMPQGRERDERLKAIDSRMFRLEEEIQRAA
jgi:hypothetical protein